MWIYIFRQMWVENEDEFHTKWRQWAIVWRWRVIPRCSTAVDKSSHAMLSISVSHVPRWSTSRKGRGVLVKFRLPSHSQFHFVFLLIRIPCDHTPISFQCVGKTLSFFIQRLFNVLKRYLFASCYKRTYNIITRN